MGHDWLRCQDMTEYDKFKTRFFLKAVPRPKKGTGDLHCTRHWSLGLTVIG